MSALPGGLAGGTRDQARPASRSAATSSSESSTVAAEPETAGVGSLTSSSQNSVGECSQHPADAERGASGTMRAFPMDCDLAA